jgi:hypothetical protein
LLMLSLMKSLPLLPLLLLNLMKIVNFRMLHHLVKSQLVKCLG